MKVEKTAVLAALRRQGLEARADWVQLSMPDVIDVRTNAGVLKTLGLDVIDNCSLDLEDAPAV